MAVRYSSCNRIKGGLSIKEFRLFVGCTMTYEDFERKRRLSATVA